MTPDLRRREVSSRPLDSLRRALARTGPVALVLLASLSGSGCADSPSSPAPVPIPTPTPTPPPCAGLVLSAVSSDPARDAGPSSHPDLVRFRATVSGCQLGMTITFAPGTLSRDDTHWAVSLDTDENATTGFSGRDSLHTDAAAMGAEYFVDRGSDSSFATVTATGAAGGGGTVPVTIAGDQVSLVIPMAMLGNDDGRMVFSVTVSRQLAPGTTTTILDYLPNPGVPLPRTR
jgi:hypothetical protein